MAWTRIVGGRLESRYQYSVGINYNPFPWPPLDLAAKTKLEKLAKTVLDARAAHEGATLADLYDPDVMPEDLRKAHRALDEAVDRLYRKEPFASDRERLEHLLACTKSSPRRCSPPPSPSSAGKSEGARRTVSMTATIPMN